MHFKASRRNKVMTSGLLLLMLLAYAVKAFIPAGFMPGTDANGFTKMVICSGMGEKTVFVPNEEPSGQHDRHSDKICDYQVLTGQKILTGHAPVLTPPPVVFVQARADAGQHAFSAVFSSIVFARGPPSAV